MKRERKEGGTFRFQFTYMYIVLMVFFGIVLLCLINSFSLSLCVLGYGKRSRQIFFKLYYKGKEGKKNCFSFYVTKVPGKSCFYLDIL